MSPTISRPATANDTPPTARMPPNEHATSITSSGAGPSSSTRASAATWEPTEASDRNTERSRSVRPSNSSVEPLNRMRPRSRKYARCATVSATFTLCSTRMTATPSSARRRTTGSSCPTTTGARPSDSSSMSSTLGRAMSAIPRATICCWPPDRSAAGVSSRSPRMGNNSSTSARAWATPSGSRRRVQPARSRFSPTVRPPNTPWPPGIWLTPSAAISLGGAWVMSRPSSTTAPRSASTTPLIAFSRVLLPAPLVPSRAMISPSFTSRSTSNNTCRCS